MRRKIVHVIQNVWPVGWIFGSGALLLWMLSVIWRGEYTAERAETTHESPSPREWSSGSAFFTITATCFGFYAQPRGSLLFIKSGRIWRLSPLYAFADLFSIVWVWIYTQRQFDQRHLPRPSFRAMAVSILVMRDANDKDMLKDTAGVKKYTGPNTRRDATASSSRNQESNPMTQIFEEINNYESGPSFRVFIWGPMLLQLVKLSVVSGSPLARSIGFVFFSSWLANDVLLIAASWGPLSSTDRSQTALIVDDYNPQALQLIPGSYLRIFHDAVLLAQSALSICLANAFATGGWQNIRQIWAPMLISFVAYYGFVMGMDSICQIYNNGRVDASRELYLKDMIAYTAIIDWILRLLCFLAIPPLEKFHYAEKTQQPSWYEWLG